MLRILVLATEWESRHGGLSSFNRTFCRLLSSEGCEVYCFLPTAPTDREQKEAELLGVHLVGPRHPFASDALGDKYLLCSPPNLPSGAKIDWVIGHGHITGPAALIQKLNSFPNSRLAHIVHVAPGMTEWFKGEHEASSAAAKAEYRERLEFEVATKADLVVAVGPLLRREISNLLAGDTEKICQIDPGLNFSGGSMRTPPVGNHCLFLGRAEDYRLKGLDIAVQGFASASAGMTPRPVFVVRGAEVNSSAPLRKRLSEWSGCHGCDIRVREYSPNSALLQHDLQRATMLVMPSRAEGFGLVALEALGAGVPFLASANSGFAELIREKFGSEYDQFIVPVVDDKETDALVWSEAIGAILRDPEKACRGIHSLRNEYKSKIPWEDGVRGLIIRMDEETRADLKVAELNASSAALKKGQTVAPTTSTLKIRGARKSSRRFDCNLKWNTRAGIGAWKNRPVVVGDLLLVPTCGGVWNNEDSADGVYVLRKRTGEVMHHIKTKGDSNALVVSGGLLVVGCDSGSVVCAEMDTGLKRWEVDVRDSVLAKPTIVGSAVVVATMSGDVVCLDLVDGSERSRHHVGGGVAADPVLWGGNLVFVTIRGELLIFGLESLRSGHTDYEVTALSFPDYYSETGESLCEFWATPLLSGAKLFLPFVRGTLYEGVPVMAYDLASKSSIWTTPTTSAEFERLYGNVRANPCGVGDMAILALTYGNQVIGVDSSGSIKWITECGVPFFEQYGSPEICGDLVLVPRYDGYVHALEAESGDGILSLKLGDAAGGPPILDVRDVGTSWENPDGNPINSGITVDEEYFYVIANDGQVFCYELAEDLDI